MTTPATLLPCPFCGGPAWDQSYWRGRKHGTFIACGSCDATAPNAKAWNARVAAYPSMVAEVERLRTALEIIAGKRQCVDNLMSNADVARAALSPEAP